MNKQEELTYRLRCQDCGFEHDFFRGWSFAGKGCSGDRVGPNTLLHHWRPLTPNEEARSRAVERWEEQGLSADLLAFGSARLLENKARLATTGAALREVLLETAQTEASI